MTDGSTAPGGPGAPAGAPGGFAPSPEALEREYQTQQRWCDELAVQAKLNYRVAWAVALGASWLTLLLAIAGLALPEARWLPALVLGYAGRAGTLAALAATAYQLFWRPRERWRNARRAAEELRSDCMRYRLGLAPYDGAGAAAAFFARIQELGKQAPSTAALKFLAQKDDGTPLRKLATLAWVVRLPEERTRPRPHAPDAAGATGRGGDLAARVEAALVGRLESQQHWHLRKARGCLRAFLGFQGVIILVNLLGTVLPASLVVTALATAVSLLLYAVRDGLDVGPLWQRYVWVAERLEEVRRDYANQEGDFEGLTDEEERLRRLGEKTECVLASECQYWYASVG